MTPSTFTFIFAFALLIAGVLARRSSERATDYHRKARLTRWSRELLRGAAVLKVWGTGTDIRLVLSECQFRPTSMPTPTPVSR